MRGFCNHESFAVVGAALPARVDLLRVQQVRGMGGNYWRTSHNAPEIALLEVTDRLGILVMDENRVFATCVLVLNTDKQPHLFNSCK
jgi:beta-galactosidase/beta-glucuronidase